jgi:hypothetical protein
MKLSVVVNPGGEIVGAAIPGGPHPAVGPYALDELKIPDGHKMHEVNAPPELAKAFLDGNFSDTFEHFKLAHEGGTAFLKRK